MNANKAQELQKLLDEVMPQVVIRDKNNRPLIPPGPYENTLRLEQQSYQPVLHSSSYKPEILDEALRDKLLGFIRHELKEYIYKDRIQPAVLPTGFHILGGVTIDMLLTHLLKIAIAWEPSRAINAFIEAIENPYCPFQEIAVIDGLKVKNEVDIYDGVRLVPLPKSRYSLPPYLPRSIDDSIPLDYFKEATLLIVDRLISPRFARPDEKHINLPPPFGFQITVKSTEPPSNFNLYKLCAVLSLVCQVRVYPTIHWYYMASDELANISGIEGFHYENVTLCVPAVEISDNQVQESKRLYQLLSDLDSKTQERLAVPISRWIESKREKSNVDQIIDLGIALECLYLRDAGSELVHRLSLRGAWYLGKDIVGREKIAKQIKNIYDARSKAVHAGVWPLKRFKSPEDLIEMGQDLCRESIIKIIQEGQFPDWNTLVLGG